jgi:hypothetical protein
VYVTLWPRNPGLSWVWPAVGFAAWHFASQVIHPSAMEGSRLMIRRAPAASVRVGAPTTRRSRQRDPHSIVWPPVALSPGSEPKAIVNPAKRGVRD